MEMDLLVDSEHQGIDLVGPVPSSKSWQDRVEGALDHTQFHIDWQHKQVTCPQGKVSICCSERKTWRGTPNFVFTFDNKHIHQRQLLHQHRVLLHQPLQV